MHAPLAFPVSVVSSKLTYAKALSQELICASQFEIRGEILLARESAQFGLSEFKAMGSKHYQIAPVSLDEAMRQAHQQYSSMLDGKTFALFNTHQGPEPVKGVFHPKEICVMDDYGAVIGLYTEGVWRNPPPRFVWKFMTEQADKSRNDAARAAQRFNAEEAQELQQYASYLDEMADMSINHHSGRIFRENIQ